MLVHSWRPIVGYRHALLAIRGGDSPSTLDGMRRVAIPGGEAVGDTRVTERERVLEFLRAFVNGGVNQDFRNWAEWLYRDMRAADAEPTHRCIYYPDCAVCGPEAKHGIER